MAKVLQVNISETTGVPKVRIEQGYFKVDHGLEGDAHAKNWHRQVSLLAIESIEKAKAQILAKNGDPDILDMGQFAENLTTEGIVLYELPVGTRLKIGETEMEVTQIGKECHTGCAIRAIVGDCIMPREGIFAKVLQPCWIKAGDSLEILFMPAKDKATIPILDQK